MEKAALEKIAFLRQAYQEKEQALEAEHAKLQSLWIHFYPYKRQTRVDSRDERQSCKLIARSAKNML